jgi:Raf kinase inhibitor-like YbhB/YbcL family protein
MNTMAPRALAALVLALFVTPAALHADDEHALKLRSASFADGGRLPISAIFNAPDANGQNTCSPDGSAGGDTSPELHWTHVPDGTHSFVLVVYDVTASFTHWAMYDIPAGTRELPANAGAAGSGYGTQVSNDFGDLSYDGPCPPTAFMPFSHQYVFTLYALDRHLPAIPSQGDFPPGSEALYHALIAAARDHHILASASLTGYWSAISQ